MINPEFIVRERNCERCGRITCVKLVRDISASGVSMVYWLCIWGNHPNKKQGYYIAHEKIKAGGFDPETLPTINNYSGSNLCAVCGSPYAELHHWAPKHLFGDQADHWPTAYLCKKHHDLWHKLVTPLMGMVRPGARTWTQPSK